MTTSRADAPRNTLPFLFRITASGRRLMPDAGVSVLHRSAIARPLRRLLVGAAPAGVQPVQVCGGPLQGATLFLDLSCEKYYWLGTHEERVQRVLTDNVRTGFTVYDIGAHVGFFSLLCGRLAGPDGRVYAFEPRADNIERLQRNIAINGAENIRVVPAAACDRRGDATFVLEKSTLEGHLAAADEAGGARVRTETIDALVADGMPAPDFLKVDVEGAEAAVIRGAAQTIASRRPLLLVEVHSVQAGRDVTDALPCAYGFRDIQTGSVISGSLLTGHYLGRAEEA
jgi:FkbM family methyltransferase